MTRCAMIVWAAALAAGPQDSAKISGLVRQLGADDWVDQARAAKELAQMGKPALEPLAVAALSDSPSVRYWATTVRESVLKKSALAPAPAPAPVPVVRPPVPVSEGFAPDETDVGSIMFICNNPKHGDTEVVISMCLICAKSKRFAYDHGAKCFRCSVCKREFTAVKCDKCGEPPGPRTRIRMKHR